MPQNAPYSYALMGDAVAALSLRLNDPGYVHWTQPELIFYVNESLRVWNCLTHQWAQDFTATYTSTDLVWQSTGNSQNATVGSNPTSPRFQTLSDGYCYQVAQFHLLEPPAGTAWTGSSQFTINDFTQAMQRRRDDVLQIAAANVAPLAGPISIPPGQSRIYLPDAAAQSILDIRRIRFLPDPTVGQPSTLYREDGLAMEYFAPFFPQTDKNPTSWDILASPPLALTFDATPNVANTLEILAILSGGIITPGEFSLLLIPDDFYWILKFGMMADLLRKESESTDLARAAYCETRFAEGLRLLVEFPWLLQARINNVAVDTPAVTEADDFDYEWQSNANAQIGVIVGGLDLFALSPIPTSAPVSVTLTMVGNAPVTTDLTQPIQVSRDVLDVILDESEHLAILKHGGSEFSNSLTLHQNFLQAAMKTNKRLAESGIFASTLRLKTSKQSDIDPRFAVAAVQGE
jgi:hypothetical protein